MIASARNAAIAVTALFALHTRAAAAANYTFTPLAIPQGTETLISGVYQDQVVGEGAWTGGAGGYVWNAGAYTLLPQFGQLIGVTDKGVAYGPQTTLTAGYQTYDLGTGKSKAHKYAPPAEYSFYIEGMNASGTIAATQLTVIDRNKEKVACQPFEQTSSGSYTWLADQMINGMTSIGITDDGTVLIGSSDCEEFADGNVSLYKNGVLTPFTIPSGTEIGVFFVDGNGMFGGSFHDTADKVDYGFTSKDGAKAKKYAVPGAAQTIVTGVGPAHEVAGYSIDTSGYYHGFIYAKKTYYTINYPNAPSMTITGFSSTGAIIGQFGTFAYGSGGNSSPFVATCPSGQFCTQ